MAETKVYPTEWSYGKARGSISDRSTQILLIITNSEGKIINHKYYPRDYENKKACLEKIEEDKIKYSKEYGVTRNLIRFLDEKTIEVQLTCDKTFITDAKHLKLVEKYPLFAKLKKERTKNENGKPKFIERYYVICQDKKKQFLFTSLLGDFKIVEYINGNSLDCRENNIKEFGIEQKFTNDTNEINDVILEDVSEYYFMKEHELPKNKWILGNIPGTLFYRKNEVNKILTMRIGDFDQMRTKTFNIKNFKSVEEMELTAQKYLINIANLYGHIKNRIRLHDDYLEVEITKDSIMKTDLGFLPLFLPSIKTLQSDISISETYSGSDGEKYAVVYFFDSKYQMTFHKLIMNRSMIDHINQQPLDNRLSNLRYTNYSYNNSNRTTKMKVGETGIFKIKKNNNYLYKAKLKHNYVECSVQYAVGKYTEPIAKRYATIVRKNLFEISYNVNIDELNELPIKRSLITACEFSIKHYNNYYIFMINKICHKWQEYMPEKSLSKKMRKNIWNYYYSTVMGQLYQLEKSIDTISNFLSKISAE